jgi:hypothetical protein
VIKAKYDADKAPWDEDNTLFGGVEPIVPTAPVEPVEPVSPILRDGSSSENAELREMADVYIDIAEDLNRRNSEENADIIENTVVIFPRNGNDGKFNIHFADPLQVNLQVGAEAGQSLQFNINYINPGTL